MRHRLTSAIRPCLLAASALGALATTPAMAQAQGAGGATPAPAERTPAADADRTIVVTGSRLGQSTFDTPSPVTVLGGEDLARRGITNVAEALTELPAFRDTTSPTTQGWGSFNVGARIVNLRGLGVTRNLVLVNGRRFAPTTREGSVDLNFIPSILIDRTEIVTGGASAAYGSDAITGVINVILDTNLEGLKAEADFGISEEGDGERYHAALAYGTALGDRGHFVIGGEWADQKGIGNCFTRDWCTSGAIATNVGFAAGNGMPNLVRSDDNGGFRFNNGGVIYAAGPTAAFNLFGTGGVTFDENGQPQPFRVGNPSLGLVQVGGDIVPTYSLANITVPVERYSVNAYADYEVTDSITVFVEGTYGHVYGELLQTAFFNPALPIYADNPYIPAAVRAVLPVVSQRVQPTGPASLVRPGAPALTMGRLFDDLERGFSTSKADTYRASAGIQGSFGGGWNWDGYYQYSRTDRLQRVENNLVVGDPARPLGNPSLIAGSNAFLYFAADAVINPATGAPTCRALLSPDPALRAAAAGCVPLNLFGPNNYDPAALDYVYSDLIEDIKLDQHIVSANVTGTLGALQGGDLAVAIGGEYRIDSIDVTHDDLSNQYAYFQNFGADYDGETEVIEGYIEVALPLLADMPGVQSLDINAALRQTHYNISGFGSYLRTQAKNSFDATAWKISGNWSPTDWFRIRASRSRDIRAPNFAELFLASASSFSPLTNPFVLTPAGSPTAVSPSLVSGGSPFLRPEKADTWQVGAVLTPGGALDGLRISVDYFDISVKDYIGSPPGGAQNILNECRAGRQAACGLINDGTVAMGDDITEIRNISLNLEELRTDGIDIEADYRIDLGGQNQLLLRALATWMHELSTRSFGQYIDRVGQTGGTLAIAAPEWSANGFVTFVNPNFTLGVQGRYIDNGVIDTLYTDPSDPNYSPRALNSINDNSVPDRFYVNLFGTAKIPGFGEDQGFELFGRVNNLFNKEPPIIPETQFPTNPVYFDTIGRYFTIGARARF